MRVCLSQCHWSELSLCVRGSGTDSPAWGCSLMLHFTIKAKSFVLFFFTQQENFKKKKKKRWAKIISFEKVDLMCVSGWQVTDEINSSVDWLSERSCGISKVNSQISFNEITSKFLRVSPDSTFCVLYDIVRIQLPQMPAFLIKCQTQCALLCCMTEAQHHLSWWKDRLLMKIHRQMKWQHGPKMWRKKLDLIKNYIYLNPILRQDFYSKPN